MSDIPPVTKRKYVSRKAELDNTTIEEAQAILSEIKSLLKTLEQQLKEAPDDKVKQDEVKELRNKRVRAYARLRTLGFSSREAQKNRSKPVDTSALPPVPEDVPPAQ
jgi:hypothetical protein